MARLRKSMRQAQPTLRRPTNITILVMLCVALLAASAHSQSFPHVGLLRDINTSSSGSSSSPRDFVRVSDGTYFLDRAGGLWFTNGTRSGTLSIRLTTPEGYTSISPRALTAFKDTLAFASGFYDASGTVGCSSSSSTSGCSSQGLFIVNSSKTGVTLIREKLYIEDSVSYKRNMPRILTIGPTLLFFGSEQHDIGSAYKSNSLWKSDGTRSGTTLLHSLDGGGSQLDERIAHGSRIYFYISGYSPSFSGLWTSDGTPEGTQRITSSVCHSFTSFQGRFYFIEVKDFQSYLSVMNTGGTAIEKSVALPDSHYALASAPAFIGSGGYLYFLANGDKLQTKDLWKIDTNSVSLPMTRVAPELKEPDYLTDYASSLYFVATSATQGRELFKTNGTDCSLAYDIRSGLSGSFPEDLLAIGDQLFFTADDGDHGRELWKIDGAAGGASSIVSDIRVGLNSSLPSSLSAGKSYLVMSADDGTAGIEPWVVSRYPLGEFPTPTPTITPTPPRNPTPTSTPKSVITPGTSPTKPEARPYDISGSWRSPVKLWYEVKFNGRTKETIAVYRRGATRQVFRFQTVLGDSSAAGIDFYITLPAGRLRAGSYKWCATSSSAEGLRGEPRCAALRLK